ncbi:MAG: PIN domain-containing protein [Gemmatimonadota bacterium]
MDRLFLDANILFSAAYHQDAGVRRLWDVPQITLVTSEYAVAETRRNLANPDQLSRLDALLKPVQVEPARTLDPALRREIELREKDWPILGGAVAAGATHLITGDLRDFGPFMGQSVLGVLVLTPARYLNSTR